MEKKLTLRYKKGEIEIKVPQENLLYDIKPENIPKLKNETEAIKESLKNPISSPPLSKQINSGMKIVILGDDITRPTPKEKLILPILNELNQTGVPDKDITVIISLGTHRYMTDQEIKQCYGQEITKRVAVINHQWKDENNLIKIGSTPSGIPISVNKIAWEADYLIATGSIVPHSLAGYAGGGKAVQPGICSWETTAKTHLLPMHTNTFFKLAGDTENGVRKEMEEVAEIVGLNFIVNVVLNDKKQIVYVASGDQIKAHREGVKVARKIYEQKIPALADIVIVSAYPADIDYWQGGKPLSYAQRGLKEKGTIILVGHFPDGISPTHQELGNYNDKSYQEIEQLIKENKLKDLVGASVIFRHAKMKEYSDIICVSEGLSLKDKEKLGFRQAESVEEAIKIAFKKEGEKAKIGVIDYGGDVLPVLQ